MSDAVWACIEAAVFVGGACAVLALVVDAIVDTIAWRRGR